MMVRLVTYFSPWFFMALVPSLVIILIGRQQPYWSGFIIGLLIIFIWQYQPREFWQQMATPSSTRQLKLMTFNVNLNTRETTSIITLIEEQSPDIIAFQEMDDALRLVLHAQIQDRYPYYLVDHSSLFPLVLMSRYPLTLETKPEIVRMLHARVATPFGEIVVWNVHPYPAINLDGWIEQRQLLTSMAQDVAQDTAPVIVMGDFNSTAMAENYRLIADILVDTHATGQGLGFTFTNPQFAKSITDDYARLALQYVPPVIDVDHILVSNHFIPQSHHVLDSPVSDHLPVVAIVLVK
jgi:endonuclease/exonuclease/phosphatase family metal-dependent hydrolase